VLHRPVEPADVTGQIAPSTLGFQKPFRTHVHFSLILGGSLGAFAGFRNQVCGQRVRRTWPLTPFSLSLLRYLRLPPPLRPPPPMLDEPRELLALAELPDPPPEPPPSASPREPELDEVLRFPTRSPPPDEDRVPDLSPAPAALSPAPPALLSLARPPPAPPGPDRSAVEGRLALFRAWFCRAFAWRSEAELPRVVPPNLFAVLRSP
jgi:hypothetical protein